MSSRSEGPCSSFYPKELSSVCLSVIKDRHPSLGGPSSRPVTGGEWESVLGRNYSSTGRGLDCRVRQVWGRNERLDDGGGGGSPTLLTVLLRRVVTRGYYDLLPN